MAYQFYLFFTMHLHIFGGLVLRGRGWTEQLLLIFTMHYHDLLLVVKFVFERTEVVFE